MTQVSQVCSCTWVRLSLENRFLFTEKNLSWCGKAREDAFPHDSSCGKTVDSDDKACFTPSAYF